VIGAGQPQTPDRLGAHQARYDRGSPRRCITSGGNDTMIWRSRRSAVAGSYPAAQFDSFERPLT
jgi:hypothetical protein